MAGKNKEEAIAYSEMFPEDERDEKEWKQYLSDIRTAMKVPVVNRLIWELLDKCDFYGDKFIENERHEAFVLGRTSIGREVLEMLTEADPEIYPKMLINKAKNLKE